MVSTNHQGFSDCNQYPVPMTYSIPLCPYQKPHTTRRSPPKRWASWVYN